MHIREVRIAENIEFVPYLRMMNNGNKPSMHAFQ